MFLYGITIPLYPIESLSSDTYKIYIHNTLTYLVHKMRKCFSPITPI